MGRLSSYQKRGLEAVIELLKGEIEWHEQEIRDSEDREERERLIAYRDGVNLALTHIQIYYRRNK